MIETSSPDIIDILLLAPPFQFSVGAPVFVPGGPIYALPATDLTFRVPAPNLTFVLPAPPTGYP